jgi:hypothetical protein
MFNDLMWEVNARFVDIGEVVDHYCLNYRVIGIPTLTLLITGSPMTIQIYIKRYNKKNLHQLRMHCVINIAHINSFSL